MSELQESITDCDLARDMQAEVEARFDVAQSGPPCAYFYLPDPLAAPVCYKYVTIGFMSDNKHKALATLRAQLNILRDTVDGTAWLWWRRVPTLERASDDKRTRAYKRWRATCRVAIPGADYSKALITQEGEPYPEA